MNTQEIIDDIIRREGSKFTDDPRDRGGATKYGITQRAWDAYHVLVPIPLPSSVEFLDEATARTFYDRFYCQPLAWIENESLRVLIIDSSVQHGLPRAIQWLQGAVGVPADGVAGPMTRNVVNGRKLDKQPYNEVLKKRIRFYANIIADDATQHVFARGWLARVADFIF